MASVKLTNAIRNEIVFSILSEGIDQRIKEHDTALRKAGTKVIKSILKEYWDTMYSLPEGYLFVDSSFAVGHIQIRTESIRCPVCYRYSPIDFDIEKASDDQKQAIAEYNDIQKKYDNLKCEKVNIAREVTDILNSVRTVKQLLDVWPEVEKYLPHTAKSVDNRSLPMVQVRQLNDKLELYKEKKE